MAILNCFSPRVLGVPHLFSVSSLLSPTPILLTLRACDTCFDHAAWHQNQVHCKFISSQASLGNDSDEELADSSGITPPLSKSFVFLHVEQKHAVFKPFSGSAL